MKLCPRAYTHTEGDRWREVDNKFTTSNFELSWRRLRARFINKSNQILINGQLVHSLAFEDPICGSGNFARWDVINGWTTTLEQAKKAFPRGLHNQARYRK